MDALICKPYKDTRILARVCLSNLPALSTSDFSGESLEMKELKPLFFTCMPLLLLIGWRERLAPDFVGSLPADDV